MNANVLEAFNIMWQGMAGIFVVIGLLAPETERGASFFCPSADHPPGHGA